MVLKMLTSKWWCYFKTTFNLNKNDTIRVPTLHFEITISPLLKRKCRTHWHYLPSRSPYIPLDSELLLMLPPLSSGTIVPEPPLEKFRKRIGLPVLSVGSMLIFLLISLRSTSHLLPFPYLLTFICDLKNSQTSTSNDIKTSIPSMAIMIIILSPPDFFTCFPDINSVESNRMEKTYFWKIVQRKNLTDQPYRLPLKCKQFRVTTIFVINCKN